MVNVKNYNKIRPKDDLVVAYLKDIKGHKSKPLDKDEEKELLVEYYDKKTSNDRKIEIKKKIVMSHQRFLYDMANCYANGDNNLLLELIDVGTIGMYETFDNFDISMENKFMTYAQFYVRRAIKHFMDSENLLVRPSNNLKLKSKVKAIKEKFIKENDGREPSVFEIEQALKDDYGIELTTRQDIYDVQIESIESPTNGSEDDDYTVEKSKDFTEYASAENEYETKTNKRDVLYDINTAIDRLPEREAKIIRLAFGLDSEYCKECNNIEIGKILKLTPERIRQLKDSALLKLQSMLAKFEV